MVLNIADISPSQLYNRNTWKKKLGSVGLRPPLGSLLRRSNLLPALKTLTLPARGFFLKKKTSSVNSSHPRGFKHGPGYSDALTTRLEALSQCMNISLLTVHFLCDTGMSCDHREQNSAKSCTDQLLSCTIPSTTEDSRLVGFLSKWIVVFLWHSPGYLPQVWT